MGKRSTAPDVRYARISKSGRGSVLNLPRALVEALHWHPGTTVELWVVREHLVVSTAIKHRDLLAGDPETVEHLLDPRGGKE